MVEFLQVLIVVALVLILFAREPHSGFMQPLTQLRDELRSVFPVHSAETTRGKEAEFIRDRVPTRLPPWILLVTIAVLATALVWLAR
jgi:hypothetical protein